MSMSTTRRRFLGVAAAMAGGWLTSLSVQGQGAPGKQASYGGQPMGIQSYSLRHLDLDSALDVVRELGLHHVELYGAHLSPTATGPEIDVVLEKLRRRDIALSAHGVNRFGPSHAENRSLFEFADRAGIRNLSADPQPDDATFSSLDRLVDEFGVRIAIHNHGPGSRWDTPETILAALEGRHPGIGVCADLGHFLRSEVDPVEALRAFEGRLYGVHLKDFAERRKETRGVVLGEGHLDLVGVFSALRDVGFPADGALSLEYEEPDPLEAIRRCLEAASEAARRAATA